MGTATGQVLVVCTANICRSPTAAILIQRRTGVDSITVTSAGLKVNPGARICTRAQQFLRRQGKVDSAETHRAKSLTREAIATADLILTATRDQRSAVARLDPRATQRTFTLAEAGYLSIVVKDELDAGTAGMQISDIVARLHGERWRAGTGVRRHRLRPRSRQSDPLSLPDVHLQETRSHRLVFARIRRATTTIASMLKHLEA